ncbi:MAG TPA: serine protease [Verrucomicrobiae bacterium]|nr:serine protease [Verrucomicrobiae bacterium]
MKSLLILCVLFLAGINMAAPIPPAGVIFKPTFLTGDDSLTAGTGFVARFNGTCVFVTAHHLFGPAGGLKENLGPYAAIRFALALAALPMDNRTNVLTSTHMLYISSARAFSNDDSSKDVAAFLLPDYAGRALRISLHPPQPGDTVYLYARPRGEDWLKLIVGKVTGNSSAGLQYVYDNGKFDFAGTSGAPILNDAGEVVGINLGGGISQNHEFGFANPVQSFYPLILNAIKLEAQRTAVSTNAATGPPGTIMPLEH